MMDQTPGVVDDRMGEFAQAICRVRGWEHATAQQIGESLIRVINPAAGLWVECRHHDGAERGSMSAGRLGEPAFFQPEFIRPVSDFVTFRARQLVQGIRDWDRRRRLPRLDVRTWLYVRRIARDVARQRCAS